MGRHEGPVESGPLFEFATDLRALRRAAGAPPYRRLERTARFSASTLADAASGKRLPTRDVTLAYVAACRGDVAAWRERWTLLAAHLRGTHPDLVAVDDCALSSVDPLQPVAAGPPRSGRRGMGESGDARPAGHGAHAAAGGAQPGDPAGALATIMRQRADFDAALGDAALGDGGHAASADPGASPSAVPQAERPPAPPAAPVAGPLVEPAAREDPRRVGPFRVIGRLGAGAMGDVFLAASPAGRPVAVKLVRAQLARDEVFRRRFAREVAAARTVAGGHTPAVIDADPNAQRPWMATAYLPGPSLGQVVDTGGPLPEPVVLALAAGITEALAAIHAAGIVHRDLKPSNILLADDGPKVIDFGISRALDGTALTATGAAVGTAGYTAPELAARGEAGPASDVFSLGVLLAYAATGIPAFGEGRSSDVLYRVVHEPPAPEALACQDNNLRRLIEQCLDKDPARRPTTAQIIAASGQAGDQPLPAALAAQIAQRGQDAAALLARAQRARTARRVRIGLTPLLLILAIVTAAALSTRSGPTHLDTAPPPISATPTPRTPATAATPSTATTPGASSQSAATSAAATGGGGGAAISPSATAAPGLTSTDEYSFEDGTEGWGRSADSDVSLAPSGTHAKDGSFSLAMTDTAAQADAYVGVVVSGLSDGPAPGDRVSAWIYVPAGAGTVRAHLYTQDGGNWRQPTDTTIAPGSGWQQLSFTTPGSAGTATSVGVQFNKSGAASVTVYLDAVTWG